MQSLETQARKDLKNIRGGITLFSFCLPSLLIRTNQVIRQSKSKEVTMINLAEKSHIGQTLGRQGRLYKVTKQATNKKKETNW